MSPDELKALEQDVKKRKRIAGEWASRLHDLIEDRLPAAYEEIHDLAQATYDACKAWQEGGGGRVEDGSGTSGVAEMAVEEQITGMTRGGRPWIPAFIVELDQTTCIGCGRCFKVCPRDVFGLVERELDDDGDDDDYDDDFSDDTSMVMVISDALDCIGCEACSRVCPKDCHSHASQPLVA